MGSRLTRRIGQCRKEPAAAEKPERKIKRLNEYLTESVCKRYLPPDLVQEILDGELSLEEPAELQDITILFSDLKGFTSTSEKLGPEGISVILNEYLSKMNDVIFAHGGTIDKFIGDAIMVMFGAPKGMPLDEQAERAAACGLAMHQEMEVLAEVDEVWRRPSLHAHWCSSGPRGCW